MTGQFDRKPSHPLSVDLELANEKRGEYPVAILA